MRASESSGRHYRLGLNIYDDYYGPKNCFSVNEITRTARLAEQNGYDSVWLNEDIGRDSFLVLGNIAAHTNRIRLATGIVNIFARSPVQIAMAAATLHELSNGRAILGLGLGHDRSVQRGHGIRISQRFDRMREYVTIIRKKFSGRTFSHSGNHFQIKDTKLNVNTVDPPIPIYLAAAHPKTIQLAGEIADGVLLLMPSTHWIKETVFPRLHEGATRAGRDSRKLKVIAILHCYLSDTNKNAYDDAKKAVASYALGKSFREMVSGMGFSKEIQKVYESLTQGDRESAWKNVPNELANELVAVGPPTAVASRLRDFFNLGVDLPILSVRPRSGEGIKMVESTIPLLAPRS